jgi:hypothetical protein
MDKSLVDTQGVDYLSLCLSKTDYLKPLITQNDKTLSWDGYVEVYTNTSFRGDNLFARAPVQVKSTTKGNIDSEYHNHAIKISDLNNYFNDGGALLFIVLLVNNECKIYYDNLTQLKIKRYTKNIQNQKTMSISCKTFPKDDISAIQTIFFEFSREIRTRISPNILSLDDLIKTNPIGIDKMSMFYTGPKNSNPINYLLSHEITLYAHYSATDILFPVDIIKDANIAKIVNSSISIDGILYYSLYKRIMTNDDSKILFGESLYLINKKGTKDITFKFILKGKLSQRINDINFFLCLHEMKILTIDEEKLKIPFNEVVSEKDIQYLHDQLGYMLDIKSTLNVLGVNDDLDCDNLSEKDNICIKFLADGILNKKPQKVKSKLFPPAANMRLEVSNLTIMLFLVRYENDLYNIYNFFDDKDQLYCFYQKSEDGEMFMISPYFSLLESDFLKLSNINYNTIIKSSLELCGRSEVFEFTNELVFKMIRAFDKSKKYDVVNAALEITEWLLKMDTNEENNIYYFVNKMQIKKRLCTLSKEDIKKLNELSRTEISASLLVAIYLILGNKESALIYFDDLSEKDKMEFSKCPVHELWKL